MKLPQIKELLSKISSWPWKGSEYSLDVYDKEGFGICTYSESENIHNFPFIALAPTIIDQLIKQNKVMREALVKVYDGAYYDVWECSDIRTISKEAIKEVERIENENR
jgi:hypothetical protein